MAKEADYSRRLNRFDVTLKAYVQGMGDVSLDNLKAAYDEIILLESTIMENKALRGRYPTIKQIAENVISLGERVASTPRKPQKGPGPSGRCNTAFDKTFKETQAKTKDSQDLDIIESGINTLNYLFCAFDLDDFHGQIGASQFADAMAYRDELLKKKTTLEKGSCLKRVLNYDITFKRKGETHGES